MKDRLLRVYHQMPEPKAVVALGSCPASNGVFDGCYGVAGPLDKIIPVDVWVPGCPPRPEAIIHGIVKAMGKIEGLEE
jgi:Ni,Fe-hydrogenase III small subunit